MADQLMITTLAWTLTRLSQIRSDATKLVPEIDAPVAKQLDLAKRVSDSSLVSQATPIRPTEQDLRILGREGSPWSAVSSVAREVRRSDTSLNALADELLLPDPDIRWRLFHLSILGIVLVGARNAGASITATAPLTRSSDCAAFRIRTEDDLTWDLWFEGETVWSAYGKSSPYLDVTKELSGAQRPLSPDLLLVRGDNYAVSIECKYSQDSDYQRKGVREAMAYATDLAGHLATSVDSLLVTWSASQEVIGTSEILSGTLAVHSPGSLLSAMERIFAPSSAGDH